MEMEEGSETTGRTWLTDGFKLIYIIGYLLSHILRFRSVRDVLCERPNRKERLPMPRKHILRACSEENTCSRY